MRDHIDYWLALHHCPNLGPASYQVLLNHFNAITDIFDTDQQDLLQIGLSAESANFLCQTPWSCIDADLDWLTQDRHSILTLDDPDYPALLRETAAPPLLLYVIGSPALLSRPQIAMVGSRNPTAAGSQIAYDFASQISLEGLVITSGLAIGIDTQAHRGALDSGQPTIAVTGTGLDRIYPARNRELAHDIATQGAIVSEFKLGTPPKATNFPRRNRIISALSLGTLVVEAALRSGSLITANYALEQGREVFAIPSSIHNPLAKGCHHLLKQGAKLVETIEDVITELPPQQALATRPQTIDLNENYQLPLEPEYSQLLDKMGFAPVAIDQLIQRSGLTAEEVSSMMLILELQGQVASSPGGCYIRVKK